MKKIIVVLVALVCIAGLAYGADDAKVSDNKAAPSTPPMPRQMPNLKSDFSMLFGNITKIDTSDPQNTRIEVASQTDNQTHVLSVTPWTNVMKVTDLSDLKQGDQVRVMARKTEGKEVAVNIMFGKMKPIPARPDSVPPQVPAAPQAPKK